MARPRRGLEIGASTGVALRITPELRRALDRLARKHHRSITQELRAALEDHVMRHVTANGSSHSDTNGADDELKCISIDVLR